MKGWPFLRIALLAALLLFSGIAIPVAATDLTYAGQTITISSPGSYVLTNDVTDSRLATCIEIRAPDVVLYVDQMDWIAANEPVPAFDYNGNGRIDVADVVWLFNKI